MTWASDGLFANLGDVIGLDEYKGFCPRFCWRDSCSQVLG